MDFGLTGRTAIVCASTGGLGYACAKALAGEGVRVVLNGRNSERLARAVSQLQGETGAEVLGCAGDIANSDTQERLVEVAGQVDILVNNGGGPPAGDFRDWTRADWEAALHNNLIAPVEMIRQVVDDMIARRFGRIVNITSMAVRAPIPQLGLSNAARTGLTGFVAGLSRQVAEHNVTINNILPGIFDTDRTRTLFEASAKGEGKTLDAIYQERIAAQTAKRIGSPEEFGLACLWLCAAQSGYVVGQNILLDGGQSNISI